MTKRTDRSLGSKQYHTGYGTPAPWVSGPAPRRGVKLGQVVLVMVGCLGFAAAAWLLLHS